MVHYTPCSRGEYAVSGPLPHTRKRYSTEEKIRIVLEGIRGEDGIAEWLSVKQRL